jgi:hypothetical protein
MEQTITRNQTEIVQPIINGSFNPRLTHDQFKGLDRETKIGFLWRVLVSMEFSHSLRDVDQEVFKKGEKICDYDHLQKEDTDLDELFHQIKSAYDKHQSVMQTETNQRRYILGQKFWHAQSECGMGGMIETDYARAQGYISAIGNWNDFNVTKVNSAISRVEDKCPRVDYGANNPNTGIKMHKWKVTHRGEYVILSFDFVNEKAKERIEKFFPTFESIGKSAKADSIRIEIEEHGNGYYGVELYWWWD